MCVLYAVGLEYNQFTSSMYRAKILKENTENVLTLKIN